MLNHKTFCILPFVHTTIQTNGDIRLCCVSNEVSAHNIKTSTISEQWNSDYLKDVREKILSGEELAECTACYKLENLNFISNRQLKNVEYKVVQIKHADKIIKYLNYDKLSAPIDVEVQCTNLCNLKCLMCDERDSSTIMTENKKLKIEQSNQSEFEWNAEAIDQIRKLFQDSTNRLINLRGGEPFMVPQIKEILMSSVNNGTAKHIKLHITTNCTKFDKSWIDILSNFKEVRMMCSLDAIGELSEYARYGSNWQTIQNNISLMRKIPNINIVVNAVVQNITLLGLSALIEWCQQEKLYVRLVILQTPIHYRIDVLPSSIHEQAHRQLIETYNTLTDKSLVDNLDNLITALENITSEYQQSSWLEFVTTIKMRESIRKNSLLTVMPELSEYWNA